MLTARFLAEPDKPNFARLRCHLREDFNGPISSARVRRTLRPSDRLTSDWPRNDTTTETVDGCLPRAVAGHPDAAATVAKAKRTPTAFVCVTTARSLVDRIPDRQMSECHHLVMKKTAPLGVAHHRTGRGVWSNGQNSKVGVHAPLYTLASDNVGRFPRPTPLLE